MILRSGTAIVLALMGPTVLLGAPASQPARFSVQEESDRLIIRLDGQAVANFVFRDPKTLRPYFSQVHTPGGLQVTRTHPPIPGTDATDHDTIHPGIWIGFGDISGNDYWRNKVPIEHLRFVEPPRSSEDQLRFATESRLTTPDHQELSRLTCHYALRIRPAGWRLDWVATFHAPENDIVFGDQEEMGFGARVATPLTEKAGGVIRNSAGKKTAAATWGQAATWSDYSGKIDTKDAGITLMASPANFRPSWWHNRDYGVFVANPFGRAAMRQGDKSEIVVAKGSTLSLHFAAVIHEGPDYDAEAEFQSYQKTDNESRHQAK